MCNYWWLVILSCKKHEVSGNESIIILLPLSQQRHPTTMVWDEGEEEKELLRFQSIELSNP